MKIVVTGASGLLGHKIVDKLSKVHEVVGTYTESPYHSGLVPMEITRPKSIETVLESSHPDVIIHTASLSNPDFCEKNPDHAYKINVEGTRNIARAARDFGAALVHISSDYVFDGKQNPYREHDPLSPINVYGRTKAEAEGIVSKELDNALIIRPTILMGEHPHKKTFVSQTLETLMKSETVHADHSTVKYPLMTDDVANAVRSLVEEGHTGMFHIKGPEAMTRYEWALRIAEESGIRGARIVPDGTPGEAPRPKDVCLDDSKLRSLGFSYLSERIRESLRIIHNQQGCTFNMIYSARPDALVLGQSASDFRIRLGKQLAQEQPAPADIVVPIPESGNFLAMGYADQSRIPFYAGVIRDYETPRTLFSPTVAMRTSRLEKKLIAVPDIVRGKNLVLIDEAIIAGTTMAVVVDKLKAAGAGKIHVRIPSPPMRYNCRNGVLLPDATLIARRHGDSKEAIEEGLRAQFGVDSLRFLSEKGFVQSLADPARACTECFRGREHGK